MIDAIDRKLLALLQQDATLTVAELGERVGLSATPCWKRLKRLEEDGYIRGRVALVDRDKIGLPVTVFVTVKGRENSPLWLDSFSEAVSRMPEVVELHRMSGDNDYLLKVVVADIPGYDRFYKKMIQTTKAVAVSSTFAIEQVKYSTALPI